MTVKTKYLINAGCGLVCWIRFGAEGLHLPPEDVEVEVEAVVPQDGGHDALGLIKLTLNNNNNGNIEIMIQKGYKINQ